MKNEQRERESFMEKVIKMGQHGGDTLRVRRIWGVRARDHRHQPSREQLRKHTEAKLQQTAAPSHQIIPPDFCGGRKPTKPRSENDQSECFLVRHVVSLR